MTTPDERRLIALGGSIVAVTVPADWTVMDQVDPDRALITQRDRASSPVPGPMLIAAAIPRREEATTVPDVLARVAFSRTDFTIVGSAPAGSGPIITATFRQGPYTFVSTSTGWTAAEEVLLLDVLCVIEEYGALQSTITAMLQSAALQDGEGTRAHPH